MLQQMVTWRRWRRSRPLSNSKFICIFYHNFSIYLSNEYVQFHFLFSTIQFLHFYCLLGSNEFIGYAVAAVHHTESTWNLYQFRTALTDRQRQSRIPFEQSVTYFDLSIYHWRRRALMKRSRLSVVNVMATLLSMSAPSLVRQSPQLSIACIALPTKII